MGNKSCCQQKSSAVMQIQKQPVLSSRSPVLQHHKKAQSKKNETSVMLSKRVTPKFTIGAISEFEDLEFNKEVHRPGWKVESDGVLCYCIMIEENLGMKLVRRFLSYPFLALLPERNCNGLVQRSEYKGYRVVIFKVTEPSSNNRDSIERCVRKLRAAGAAEFDNIMTFYGSDFHTVFTSWANEERALRAQSNSIESF